MWVFNLYLDENFGISRDDLTKKLKKLTLILEGIASQSTCKNIAKKLNIKEVIVQMQILLRKMVFIFLREYNQREDIDAFQNKL